MKRTDVVAMGLLFLVGACAPAKPDTAADITAVGKVRDAWAAGFKAGNAAAIAALYTSDGQVMDNEAPTASGTQAIEASLKGMFGAMASQDIVITPVKTEVSGDLAYDVGHGKVTLKPKTGTPVVDSSRYLVILKRQADGSWKLIEDIGNRFSPAAPMPAPPKKK